MINIDFFIAGFSKCGTTTLCSHLNQHPDIFIPPEKEPWFFSSSEYEDRKEEYASLYLQSSHNQLLGDGSTSYSSYRTEDLSISRISLLYPNCKIIFIARNPIDRIESSFREMHHSSPKYGFDTPFKLSDAINLVPQMKEDSKYNERIKKYYDVFPSDNILVIFLEDLKSSPQAELNKCFKHLNIEQSIELSNIEKKHNAADTKLYDSNFLRNIRNTKWLGPLLARVSIDTQDKYLTMLGLRKQWKMNVAWDKKAVELLANEIQPDCEKFLTNHGKEKNFWDKI